LSQIIKHIAVAFFCRIKSFLKNFGHVKLEDRDDMLWSPHVAYTFDNISVRTNLSGLVG